MYEKVFKKIKSKEVVKIVCYGDSITYGYPCNANNLISQVNLPYPKLLESSLRFKFENPNISVINKGHVGWQTHQAYKYIYDNVVKFEPHLCIIMFGINDCKGSLMGGIPVLKKHYEKHLNNCVDTLLENNIAVILLTPTPALIPRLQSFSSVVFDVAMRHNLKCIDMYTGIKEILKAKNESYESVFLDGIHFRDDAYRFISDILLEEFLNMSISNNSWGI